VGDYSQSPLAENYPPTRKARMGNLSERKEKMTIAAFIAAFLKILSTPSLVGKLFLLLTKLLAGITP